MNDLLCVVVAGLLFWWIFSKPPSPPSPTHKPFKEHSHCTCP